MAAYLAARKAQRHIGYHCRGGCPQPAAVDFEVAGPAAPAAQAVELLDEDLADQPAPVLDLDQLRNLNYIPDEPPVAAYQPMAEVQPRNPLDLPRPEGLFIIYHNRPCRPKQARREKSLQDLQKRYEEETLGISEYLLKCAAIYRPKKFAA